MSLKRPLSLRATSSGKLPWCLTRCHHRSLRLFNQYLLSTYLLGTVLNLVDSMMNKIDENPCLHRVHILVRAKHKVNKAISNWASSKSMRWHVNEWMNECTSDAGSEKASLESAMKAEIWSVERTSRAKIWRRGYLSLGIRKCKPCKTGQLGARRDKERSAWGPEAKRGSLLWISDFPFLSTAVYQLPSREL